MGRLIRRNQGELCNKGAFAAVADARYSLALSRKANEDVDLGGLFFGCTYLVPKRG